MTTLNNEQKRKAMNTRRQTGNARSAGGQGLVEGVCGTSVIVFTFVLLTMLGLNVYATIVAHEKLRVVAMEAARVLDGKQYWLGMKRPGTDAEAEKQHAKESANAIARALCKKLGLPEPSAVEFSADPDPADASISFSTCRVTCPAVPLPFGISHVFPSFLAVSETGVAGNMAVEPYAILDLEVPLAGKSLTGTTMGGNAAVMVPIYGTTFGPQTSTPNYRDQLHGGIEVGEVKGPFKAVRVTLLNPPGQLTSVLNAEVASYGAGMPATDPTISSIAPIGTSTAAH